MKCSWSVRMLDLMFTLCLSLTIHIYRTIYGVRTSCCKACYYFISVIWLVKQHLPFGQGLCKIWTDKKEILSWKLYDTEIKRDWLCYIDETESRHLIKTDEVSTRFILTYLNILALTEEINMLYLQFEHQNIFK